MQWYHFSLASVTLIALALAWKTPRAKIWIGALVASYMVSMLYLYMPKSDILPWWPPQSGIVFFCDAAVILSIWQWGQERWEQVGLRAIVMLSATADLVQTLAAILGFPPPMPQHQYGLILEVINYLALAMIGGVGLLDRIEAKHEHLRIHFYHMLGPVIRRARHLAHKKSGPTSPLTKW